MKVTIRFAVVLAMTVSTLGGCASMSGESQSPRSLGWSAPLGKGTAASYAEFDRQGAPKAIGIVFSATALDGLPAASDGHRCHARGKDGAIDGSTKCQQTVERVLPLPDAAARRADIPFKWVLLNWNHIGHIPPGIYDVPHFDIHFQMASIEDIFAIEPGPCGPEYVRCDQFQIGRKAVAPNYMHADYKDVEAVVPAMGNHLIDLTAPEFNKQPFTRSFIYGVYDGKVIFYEEMVTRAHLLNKPNTCTAIKLPKAVDTRGYYPTVSCIRHDAATGEYTVSMEQFVLREASAPESAGK
jgi:hypothetical protein